MFTGTIDLNLFQGLISSGFLPQLAGAGAAGGTIGTIILGGPVSWTVVGGAVVITGVALGAVYLLSKIWEQAKLDYDKPRPGGPCEFKYEIQNPGDTTKRCVYECKGNAAPVVFNCPVGQPCPSVTENEWVKTW